MLVVAEPVVEVLRAPVVQVAVLVVELQALQPVQQQQIVVVEVVADQVLVQVHLQPALLVLSSFVMYRMFQHQQFTLSTK
jgi:hypothetical protein